MIGRTEALAAIPEVAAWAALKDWMPPAVLADAVFLAEVGMRAATNRPTLGAHAGEVSVVRRLASGEEGQVRVLAPALRCTR